MAGSGELRRITEEVARRPVAWDAFRESVRTEFDTSAARYEDRLAPDHLAPLEEALSSVAEPRRALDVGCGTGVGTYLLGRTFPSARVIGLDLSPGMIRVAAAKPRPPTIGFVVGDAASLPFSSGSFDLIVAVAVPLFAGETARVLAPKGTAIVTFPLGQATPIFLSSDRIERMLRVEQLGGIEHGTAGRGTFTLGRKP